MDLFRFAAALIFAFYIPGNIFVRKIPNFSAGTKIALSLVSGMVFWGYQGFVLGFLNFRQGTYLYLLICFVVWLLFRQRGQFNPSGVLPKKIDWVLTGIFAVGIIFWLSAVWSMPSCCRGVPDGVYHLALTHELVKNMPPFEPGADGVIVRNYHYWSDLIMAETVRVFGTNLVPTVYRFFPVLLAMLFAGALVSFVRVLGLSPGYLRLLALFIFFGGDLLFLLTFILGRGWSFDLQILDDATKVLAGPPRSFSLVVVFWLLSLLVVWIKKRSFWVEIILVVLLASLAGLKIYTWVFAFLGLGALSVFYLYKKDFGRLVLPAAVLTISFLIYWPVNAGKSGLVWTGPLVFRDFIVRLELGLENLRLAQVVFERTGKWWRVAGFDFWFGLLFSLGNFGILNLAFFQTRKSLKHLPVELHIFLISGILGTAILGFFTYQKVGGGNTIQFVIALYFFLAIYAAISIEAISRKLPRVLGILFITLVVLLTIPRAVHEGLQNFWFMSQHQGYTISPEEFQVLDYLRKINNQSRVILYPVWADDEFILHVNFLANKPLYLAGYQKVLASHGVAAADKRRAINKTIFTSPNASLVENLLKVEKIGYLYLPAGETLAAGDLEEKLKPVVSNPKVQLLEFVP